MKTNRERVLDYLRSVSPRGATNAEIRDATRIHPHQQVFQITQKLRRQGRIAGRRNGREWEFFIGESSD